MTVFGVFRNSDLTEGRGSNVFVALFASEAAAQEAALGIDVQGSNGVVRSVEVFDSFESYFAQAADWERDQHRVRLRKARDRITAMIDGTR